MYIVKIFKYIEPLWLGSNNKVSIRRTLALVFAVDLVKNIHHSVFHWIAGEIYTDVVMLIGIEASLIAALLSLTTYSASIIGKKQSVQSGSD